jgi:transposase
MANNAIWLENWTVTALRREADEAVAEASYDIETRDCPKCGAADRLYRHGTKLVQYRDIPTFGKPLTIKAEVARYKCRECGKTSMQHLSGMDGKRRMTSRLIDYIIEQGIDQSYSAVARHVNVDDKTVWNICEEQVQRVVKRNMTEPVIILGIDELTIRKQKRTVFVDVANRKLLDLIESMSKTAVSHWLSWMPNRDRVRIVTIDMWGPYAEVAEALLPNAIIVTDKFHVVKKANEALDSVRSRFRKGAKGKLKKNPRRGRIIMHKRPEKLSVRRRVFLDALLANNPLLKDGWETKEGFYAIWGAETRADAEQRFDAWKASIPDSVKAEFAPLGETVENWRKQVFNYFDYRFTNAYTESRNRLMKDFNRVGRGYDFYRLRAKALLQKPITSKPLVLCESCLGVFPDWFPLERHTDPMTGNTMRICASCHRRFHTAKLILHEINSTPKSE